eukprot:TRINITY_DN10306_c0_g1_i1.p1 TRINITY_DN10306_c0_g1~~TRINITY_DN10306_c0_g1_i1.p1  ORF type:complete len:248 (-),score=36.56 TRINITY_DN10306_c0_g1_i1:72-815(-)
MIVKILFVLAIITSLCAGQNNSKPLLYGELVPLTTPNRTEWGNINAYYGYTFPRCQHTCVREAFGNAGVVEGNTHERCNEVPFSHEVSRDIKSFRKDTFKPYETSKTVNCRLDNGNSLRCEGNDHYDVEVVHTYNCGNGINNELNYLKNTPHEFRFYHLEGEELVTTRCPMNLGNIGDKKLTGEMNVRIEGSIVSERYRPSTCTLFTIEQDNNALNVGQRIEVKYTTSDAVMRLAGVLVAVVCVLFI